MENKKFLSQANELGPNHGKAIRTRTERHNLGVHLDARSKLPDDFALLFALLVILVWWLL